jgi:hypothetical protein
MQVKRCKHGMIENQCGICQKWQEHCWTEKKEENEKDCRADSKEGAKA